MTERRREIFVWRGWKSQKGALIEGCFKAVKGWPFGIIMVICLRGGHPDRLLMSAACAVFPNWPGQIRLSSPCGKRPLILVSRFDFFFSFSWSRFTGKTRYNERGRGCLLV